MKPVQAVPLNTIISEVCRTFGTTPEDIASPERGTYVVLARRVIVHLAHDRIARYSFPAITYAMYRDHRSHTSQVDRARRANQDINRGRTINIGGELVTVNSVIEELVGRLGAKRESAA